MRLDMFSRHVHLMQDIENEVGGPIFDQDPYVKFLPLILYPLKLNWSIAQRCNHKSEHRIVIVVYGRDPIAFEGWLRLAVIATYSVLHCRGVDGWAVDLVIGGAPLNYKRLPIAELFGGNVEPALARIASLGVSIIRVEGLDSPGEVYRSYASKTKILFRLDADAGLFPGTLEAPCFTFGHALGHSGLNFRHTCLSGLSQLVDEHGRMGQWPPGLRRSAQDWLYAVVRAGRVVLGIQFDCEKVRTQMEGVPWLSEGLSYLRGEHVGVFVALRDELVSSGVVPAWDEESVKLALVGLLCLSPEVSRVPVLEHWEYEQDTSDVSVVNFRNIRSLGPMIRTLLTGGEWTSSAFTYLRDFTADIYRRAAKRGRCD